jgi:hypothetical protein
MRSSALICAIAVTATLCGAAQAQDNSVQSPIQSPSLQSPSHPTNGPQTTGQAPSPRQAPVGHRQPTAKDVPPREQSTGPRSPEAEDLDKKLKICRNC